jgi:hypothetical protein
LFPCLTPEFGLLAVPSGAPKLLVAVVKSSIGVLVAVTLAVIFAFPWHPVSSL